MILDSATFIFELIVDISLKFVVMLFLFTLLSAYNTDTFDCNVEMLFLFVVLSVFNEEISNELVLIFVELLLMFVSLVVFLVLFEPIYVVKLD